MRALTVVAVVAMAVSAPSQAISQSCFPRGAVVNELKELGREPYWGGVTADGRLMELFLNENGEWTATVSTPYGVTCVIFSGPSWGIVEPVEPNGEPS